MASLPVHIILNPDTNGGVPIFQLAGSDVETATLAVEGLMASLYKDTPSGPMRHRAHSSSFP